LAFLFGVNISDVCLLPSFSARRELGLAGWALRATFFWHLYVAAACISIALITLVWLSQKARSRRDDDSSRSPIWRPLDVTGSDDSESAAHLDDGSDGVSGSDDDFRGPAEASSDAPVVRHHYEAVDVFFAVYYSVYQLAAVQSSALFLILGVYDNDLGLNFECSGPWVCELLAVHFVIALGHYFKQPGLVPLWPGMLLASMLPLLSDRWDVLKDVCALTVYVADGAWISVILSLLSFGIPTAIVIADPFMLTLLKKDVWPGLALETDPDRASWAAWAALKGLRLCEGMGTAQKQVIGFWEGVLQGSAALVFTLRHDYNTSVLVAGSWSVVLAVLLYVSRPYVLCRLSLENVPWRYPSAADIARAYPHLHVSQWVFATDTARKIIFDVSTPVAVRAAVAKSLATYLQTGWPELKEEPAFHTVHLSMLQSLVERRDAKLFAQLAKSLPLLLEDRDVLQPAAKEKAWAVVASALPHVTGANLNYLGIDAVGLQTVLRRMSDRRTKLQYLNLNDNKTLGCEDGVRAVVRLIELSPHLRELKIKNIGISEDGLRQIRQAVPQGNDFKLIN
jgi:hypothetical protein